MFQRFPIAFPQIKAGTTSEHLLNERRQITYSLYREKEATKKVYNNIMNSIMDTIFMNSGNSKTSDPRELLFNHSDKTNIKGSDKYVVLSNLSI